MITDESVKKNVERIRKSRGVTQEAMGASLGLSRTAYRNFERKGGTSVINPTLLEFSRVMEVPLEELILGEQWTDGYGFREAADMEERMKAQREDYEERLEKMAAKIRELGDLLEDKNSIIRSQKGIIDFYERHS